MKIIAKDAMLKLKWNDKNIYCANQIIQIKCLAESHFVLFTEDLKWFKLYNKETENSIDRHFKCQ